MRVKYNENMEGVVIDENKTHVLIKLDSGTKYCVSKFGIDKDKYYKDKTK